MALVQPVLTGRTAALGGGLRHGGANYAEPFKRLAVALNELPDISRLRKS